MYNAFFWKDVSERVLATVAQVLIAMLTADGFNLLTADFTAMGVAALTAAILVVLKAIVAGQVGSAVSPASLAKDSRGI